MIIFQTIKWQNFLSTGNVFTEIQLNKHKNVLFVGENGAGKSTLLDALCYVLYGKPYRNINKPQLVNAINGKGMVVDIKFSIANNQFRVIRGMKPNVFEIYKNEKLVDQDAATKDYQEVLDKILGMSFKSFKQIVILGSASFTPFMQLPALDRRQVTEDILEIEIFSKMFKLHKEKVDNKESELAELNHQCALLEQKLQLTLSHTEEKQRELKELLENKQKQIDLISYEVNVNNGNIKALQAEYQTKLAEQVDVIKETEDAPKFNKMKIQYEGKIKNLHTQKDFFHDNESCPTCRQNIEAGFKATMIAEMDVEINKVSERLGLLDEKMNYINEKQVKVRALQNEIDSIGLEINQLKATNNALTISSDQLLREYKRLVSRTDEVSVDTIETIRNELGSVNNKRTAISEEIEMMKMATMILKDSGIKTRIIRQYIPIINKLINKYLAALDFFVNFELDETFKETIRSRHRDEFSYASFSEGEKMRINIAVLFTWRMIANIRNSASTNLLIMDEIFDSSMDASGLDEFMKLLINLTADTNTFIISHKSDQLMDKFEHTVRFKKVKGFSQMEV